MVGRGVLGVVVGSGRAGEIGRQTRKGIFMCRTHDIYYINEFNYPKQSGGI
jgi:hypothetical protein